MDDIESMETPRLILWITTIEHNQWLLNRWDAGDRMMLKPDSTPATDEYISILRQQTTTALPIAEDCKAEMYRRWLGGRL